MANIMDEWIHEIERATQKYESTERTKKNGRAAKVSSH